MESSGSVAVPLQADQHIWETAINGPHASEREVILLSARPEIPAEFRRRLTELFRQPLDWDFIFKSAFPLGVLHWLARNVKAVGHDVIDPQVLRNVQIGERLLTARQMVLVKSLADVLTLLEERDVPAIAFKGPALSAMAYGSPYARISMDADLLVTRATFTIASKALVEQGYEPSVALDEISAHIRRKNAVSFVRTDASIDLHWTLDDFPFRARVGDVWKGSQITEIGGVPARTLAPQQLFPFLCFHGAKHAWPRLSWMVDLAQVIGSDVGLDVEAVVRESRRNRTDRMVAIGLILARVFGGARLPDSVDDWLRGKERAWRLATRVGEFLFEQPSPTAIHLFRLATLQRPLDKVRFAVHRTFRHFRPEQ